MANHKSTIDIVISTLLKATGIDAARKALSSLSSHTKKFASSVGANLMNVKAGFDIVASGAQKFLAVMSKGMEFERMTTQFKSLTGSMELAKAHMKDLQDLGRTPPFSLEEFASASQMMLKMTGGMAGFKKEMEMVGDMAAATGNEISAVGRAFGLAYQMIRDGKDFGRAGSQLVQLGILTKAQVDHFNELSKAGLDNKAIWEKLCGVFGRYKGAMAETEKTTKGVVEAIEGEATVAMTEFSTAISESAKPALEGLLGYLKRINEDGTIEDWADTTIKCFNDVVESCSAVSDALGAIYKWSGASDAIAAVKGVVGGVANYGTRLVSGLANGEGLNALGNAERESGDYAAKEFAKGYYTKMLANTGVLGGTMQWASNDNGDDDERRNEVKASRAEARAKKRAEEKAKSEAETQARIDEDMARAQESREMSKMSTDDQIEYIERKIAELEGKKRTIEIELVETRKDPKLEDEKREEVVKIDADISAYVEKLKKAKEALNKEHLANYDDYLKSGSESSFDAWLKEKKEKAAKSLADDKELYARQKRDSGVDISATAKDIDETDEAFKAWRVEHKKQVNEERKSNELLIAQKAAAEIKAEEDRHNLALQNIQGEIKLRQDAGAIAQNTIQAAQTEFDKAFAMYRSEDKGAAQIAEERDYAADYKQLQKDATRYGGKWRIDELSDLMAAGDTKGQQAKLEEWRKSSSFTPEIESMVRAAAADNTKTTAEDELRQINSNTKQLADKLDQLLQAK